MTVKTEPAGEGGTSSFLVEPGAQSPRLARRFVADILADMQWNAVRDVAVLLTSELVTNAVVHSASAAEISISVDDGATITVRDADTGPVVATMPANELSEGGRGLLLVDHLAESWGTEHSGGRKAVWFRVLPDPLPTSTVTGLEASMTGHVTVIRPAKPADRLLATLLLPPSLEHHLRPPDQAAEILARIVTALDATGATLETDAGATEPLTIGSTDGTAYRRQFQLQLFGQYLGKLILFSGRELDPEEEAFLRLSAERLAITVGAINLNADTRKDKQEAMLLADATELLAGSTTVEHVLTLSAQIVVPNLAEWCVAYSVDERGRARRVTAAHADEDRLDSLFEFLDRDPQLADAIASAGQGGQTILLPGVASVASRAYYSMLIPLSSRRNVAGLLLLGRLEPPRPSDYLAVVELGRRISLALDNARLHEQVSAAAMALQASLLPPALPRLERLQLGARYYASTPALSVGGDFYDAFSLSDGSVILAVGDVCGKGAAAAGVTRTSRDVLHLLLHDGWSITDSLRRLNRVLLEQTGEEQFCTIALARYRPGDGCGLIDVCLAGHPQPIVVRSDGTTELVGNPGGLLGILAEDALDLREAQITFQAGDSVVLYTDGVTEARCENELYGDARLSALLEGIATSNPQRVADAIQQAVARFSSGDLRDDLTVLVARATP